MPRKPRLHMPGAMYHIISRGNNRQEIFHNFEDYKRFLSIVKSVKEKYPFLLHAYCLMPNHFHLLVEVGKYPVSTVMQRLLTRYTFHFNKVHKRRGHLFQGRFKAIICEKDSYMMELVRYIHLNPVRAKLAVSPSEWEWCGHGEYLLKGNKLIDSKQVLSYFGRDPNSARKGYADFVRDGLDMGHKSVYYPEEKLPYLGGEKFIKDLISKHEDLIVKLTPEKNNSSKALFSNIIEKIAQNENIERTLIESDSRLKPVASARRKFIIQALGEGHKAANIARFLNRTQGYITQIANGGKVFSKVTKA